MSYSLINGLSYKLVKEKLVKRSLYLRSNHTNVAPHISKGVRLMCTLKGQHTQTRLALKITSTITASLLMLFSNLSYAQEQSQAPATFSLSKELKSLTPVLNTSLTSQQTKAPNAKEVVIKEDVNVCKELGDRQKSCVLIKNDEDGLEKWFFEKGQVTVVERYDVNSYLMTRTLLKADQVKEVEYYDGYGELMQKVVTKNKQYHGKNQFYFRGNLVMDVDYNLGKIVAAKCYTTNQTFSLSELANLRSGELPKCPLEPKKAQ